MLFSLQLLLLPVQLIFEPIFLFLHFLFIFFLHLIRELVPNLGIHDTFLLIGDVVIAPKLLHSLRGLFAPFSKDQKVLFSDFRDQVGKTPVTGLGKPFLFCPNKSYECWLKHLWTYSICILSS